MLYKKDYRFTSWQMGRLKQGNRTIIKENIDLVPRQILDNISYSQRDVKSQLERHDIKVHKTMFYRLTLYLNARRWVGCG